MSRSLTALVYYGVHLYEEDVDHEKLRGLSRELKELDEYDLREALDEGVAGVWLRHVAGDSSGYALSLVKPHRESEGSSSGPFDPTKLVTPTDLKPLRRVLKMLGAEKDRWGKMREPKWDIALGVW